MTHTPAAGAPWRDRPGKETMEQAIEHRVGDANYRIRRVRLIEEDPLFDGVAMTFSVEGREVPFLVEVEVAPICVHLLPVRQRPLLPQLAVDWIRAWLDAGGSGEATIRVSSDGVVRAGETTLGRLFPLRPPAAAPAEGRAAAAAAGHGG